MCRQDKAERLERENAQLRAEKAAQREREQSFCARVQELEVPLLPRRRKSLRCCMPAVAIVWSTPSVRICRASELFNLCSAWQCLSVRLAVPACYG